MFTSTMFAAGALFVTAVTAQTSLFVPEVGPGEPLAGQIAGVGSDGRTTWLISEGTVSGTYTSAGVGIGAATLVIGPTDVQVQASLGSLSAQEYCVLKGDGTADCTAIVSQPDGATTTTGVVTVSLVEIQTGASGSIQTPVPNTSSASAISVQPGSGSGSSGSPKPTSTTSTSSSTGTNTTTSAQNSGAMPLSSNGLVWGGIFAAISFLGL
ncbi:hypothetical protein ABKN59_001481 [Abortiporus biennis]